jgi:hypothetical protein
VRLTCGGTKVAVKGQALMKIGEFAEVEGTWYDDLDPVVPISIARVRFAAAHAARPADTVINVDAADGQRFQLHLSAKMLERLLLAIEAQKLLRTRGLY